MASGGSDERSQPLAHAIRSSFASTLALPGAYPRFLVSFHVFADVSSRLHRFELECLKTRVL
jgi:hypothetical protein